MFKVFRIPLNKWTVPTAVLGGIALIGAVIFGMNYNFPYTDVGNQVFRTVPIVSQVRGRVQSVPVKPNQMLHKGDVLFTLDPTPFRAKVDDLQAQIKAASQDALSLNAALSQAQAELSRAVAQRDQSRREYARYRESHAQGAFSDQMVDTRLQTWKADEASVSAAQAKVVQARNALDSVVKGKKHHRGLPAGAAAKGAVSAGEHRRPRPGGWLCQYRRLTAGHHVHCAGDDPADDLCAGGGRRLAGVRRGISPERPAASAQGEPAELMFPAIPGTVFRGEVADVLPAIGESQFQGQGKLLTTDALNTHGRALVVLKVTDPRFCRIRSAAGATLEAAVYSDHLKELSLIREDPDPYEKLGKLYLSRSLSRRARGGRPPRAAVRPRCPPGRQ
ncbi:biotin/lipoyl-binding protein [Klebsiella pneumoniae subsp. pneumoniae]|nr:biotin/lipoyl-binding protein [Klebsiella pneumoniae subsp. pneumoniae]